MEFQVPGTWCHGTIFDVDGFGYFVHLGTEEAAKDALIKQVINYHNNRGAIRSYSNLPIGGPKVLEVAVPELTIKEYPEDPGSTTSLTYANVLDEILSKSEGNNERAVIKEFRKIIKIKFEEYKSSNPGLTEEELKYEEGKLFDVFKYCDKSIVASYYKKYGVDGFIYTNKVEDPKKKSLCVAGGCNLSVVSEVNVEVDELIKIHSDSKNSYYLTMSSDQFIGVCRGMFT